MTVFVWTMALLVGGELATQVYRITTGSPAPELTVGERVIVLLLDVALIVWAFSLLDIV